MWSILALGCCSLCIQLPGESLWPVLHSLSFGNDQCTSENANVRIVTLLNRLKSRKACSLTTPETLERAPAKSSKNLHSPFWLILKFSLKELICDAPAWICWRKALDSSRPLSNKCLEHPQRRCCLTSLLHFHRRLFLYKCTDLIQNSATGFWWVCTETAMAEVAGRGAANGVSWGASLLWNWWVPSVCHALALQACF